MPKSSVKLWEVLTSYFLLVLAQLDIRVRLDQHLDKHDAAIRPTANTLHEAGVPNALLVLDVAELRDIDAGRASRWRGEGESLTHGLCRRR
jgi:hypothetical protein